MVAARITAGGSSDATAASEAASSGPTSAPVGFSTCRSTVAPCSPTAALTAPGSPPAQTASMVSPKRRAAASNSKEMDATPSSAGSTCTQTVPTPMARSLEDLEFFEEGDDALMAVAGVGDDLAGLAGRDGGHLDDLLASAGPADL